MCSPRHEAASPPMITIAERNAQLNKLSISINAADKAGNTLVSKIARANAQKILAIPVDPASAMFSKVGPQAEQTVAPSASTLELAPEKLQGMLAKRATSTLRIPATTPANT